MDKQSWHTPLVKDDAYRRLARLKRGLSVATMVGFGAFGALTFPHGARVSQTQTPGAAPPAGATGDTTTAPVAPGTDGSAATQGGSDPIGSFFNEIGSALFGSDGQGQNGQGQSGQGQSGQGGYGFGPAGSGGAPATGSGVS